MPADDPKQALLNVDPRAVFDSSTDGPQYHLTTRIDGRPLTFRDPIADPFVRCTVHLGWRDLLRGLLRRRLTVEVLVDSDNSVLIETVLGLDADWLTPKRRARRYKELNAALSKFASDLPEETDDDH